jgi:hypothetical protein
MPALTPATEKRVVAQEVQRVSDMTPASMKRYIAQKSSKNVLVTGDAGDGERPRDEQQYDDQYHDEQQCSPGGRQRSYSDSSDYYSSPAGQERQLAPGSNRIVLDGQAQYEDECYSDYSEEASAYSDHEASPTSGAPTPDAGGRGLPTPNSATRRMRSNSAPDSPSPSMVYRSVAAPVHNQPAAAPAFTFASVKTPEFRQREMAASAARTQAQHTAHQLLGKKASFIAQQRGMPVARTPGDLAAAQAATRRRSSVQSTISALGVISTSSTSKPLRSQQPQQGYPQRAPRPRPPPLPARRNPPPLGSAVANNEKRLWV